MRATVSAVALCVLIAGCEHKPPQPQKNHDISAVDDVGRTVALVQPATRVVSLLPTITDLIVAMHQQHKLIARTDYDLDPQLASLPSIGGGLTPSVEWLVGHKPDLIFSWPDRGSRSLVTQMQSAGLRVFGLSTDTIANTFAAIDRIGTLLGAKHEADSLAHSMRAQLDSVQRAVAGRKPVRVLYVVSVSPPTVVGPHTFIDELIRIAGGTNIFADLSKQYSEASLEEIVQRNPDVVIVAREESFDARATLGRLAGWRDLPAVRSGHVYWVSANDFNRSGPEMPRAAAILADYFGRGQ